MLYRFQLPFPPILAAIKSKAALVLCNSLTRRPKNYQIFPKWVSCKSHAFCNHGMQHWNTIGKCLEHSCQAKLQPGCRLGKDHAGTKRNESAQGPIVYCYHGNQADRSATQNMLPLIARMFQNKLKTWKVREIMSWDYLCNLNTVLRTSTLKPYIKIRTKIN